jgi:hypothetical protein
LTVFSYPSFARFFPRATAAGSFLFFLATAAMIACLERLSQWA